MARPTSTWQDDPHCTTTRLHIAESALRPECTYIKGPEVAKLIDILPCSSNFRPTDPHTHPCGRRSAFSRSTWLAPTICNRENIADRVGQAEEKQRWWINGTRSSCHVYASMAVKMFEPSCHRYRCHLCSSVPSDAELISHPLQASINREPHCP